MIQLLTLLLLLLLVYAKKKFLSSLIFLASLDFKLFLSFFYPDFSLSLALDNACRTNYGGRRRLPPDVGCTNYRPTAPADGADVVFTQTGFSALLLILLTVTTGAQEAKGVRVQNMFKSYFVQSTHGQLINHLNVT